MSSIRITGLATGIDTDQMIKDLMKVERSRVDRVQQDKQILQWRQELYNSINKDFANFILNTKKEFGLTGTTSTGTMFNKSLSSLSWVKKATSSNESAAKVSTTSAAVNGSYELKVIELANNVSKASSEDLGPLKSLNDQFSLGDNEIKFKITSGTATEPGISKEFVFSGEQLNNLTIEDVVKQINNYKDENGKSLGVKAVYDKNINRFFIQTEGTGSNNGFSITETGTVKLFTGTESKLKLNLVDNEVYAGTDALVEFAGATNIKMGSNQFTINGINFDIKATGTTKVTVGTDTDAAYDKIKNFVDKYNELVDKIGKLLGEKPNRDFRPLTAEQKEAMKEKEVELWEEKAKKGLLRNDSIISSTMQSIRGSLYNKVEGLEDQPFNSLYNIGINTEKYSAGSIGGKLEIDEEKLRKAISEDVNGVLELLFKEPGEVSARDKDGNPITVQGKGGVITRIYNSMIDGMGEIIGKAGPGEEAGLFRSVNSRLMLDFVTKHSSISLLDKDMTSLNRRINDLNEQLIRTEDRYYRQFAAMEKFVQQMNSQGSWMMQQLGMGN